MTIYKMIKQAEIDRLNGLLSRKEILYSFHDDSKKDLFDLIIKLNESNYEFSYQQFDKFMEQLVYMKGSSFLSTQYNNPEFKKVFQIMISKFLPTATQVGRMIRTIKKNVQSVEWVNYMLEAGYKFTLKQQDEICAFGHPKIYFDYYGKELTHELIDNMLKSEYSIYEIVKLILKYDKINLTEEQNKNISERISNDPKCDYYFAKKLIANGIKVDIMNIINNNFSTIINDLHIVYQMYEDNIKFTKWHINFIIDSIEKKTIGYDYRNGQRFPYMAYHFWLILLSSEHFDIHVMNRLIKCYSYAMLPYNDCDKIKLNINIVVNSGLFIDHIDRKIICGYQIFTIDWLKYGIVKKGINPNQDTLNAIFCAHLPLSYIKSFINSYKIYPILDTLHTYLHSGIYSRNYDNDKYNVKEYLQFILDYRITPDAECISLMPEISDNILDVLFSYGLSMNLTVLEKMFERECVPNFEKFIIDHDDRFYHLLHIYNINIKIKNTFDSDIYKLRNIAENGTVHEFVSFMKEKNILPDRYCLEKACRNQSTDLIDYLINKLHCKPTIRSLAFCLTSYQTDKSRIVYNRLADIYGEENTVEFMKQQYEHIDLQNLPPYEIKFFLN